MKAFILLILLILVCSIVVWRTRKSMAEEELARRKSRVQRRKKEKEAITSEQVMIWPVIVRPLKGNSAGGEGEDSGEEVPEPSMTTIEYEPPESMTS
jgi:hypothetical protein